MGEDPNIEFLRSVYAEWAEGRFTRNDMFHPEVAFVTSGPELQTYRGPENAGLAWFDFLSAWDEFTVTAEEYVPAGRERYVVLVKLRGLGKESRIPIEGSTANLIEMRDGLIARMELIWDRGEAFEKAGVASGS